MTIAGLSIDRRTWERLVLTSAVFAADVGAEMTVTEELVLDAYAGPLSETFRCPACGTVNDWAGACSAECYHALTPAFTDPREEEWS